MKKKANLIQNFENSDREAERKKEILISATKII